MLYKNVRLSLNRESGEYLTFPAAKNALVYFKRPLLKAFRAAPVLNGGAVDNTTVDSIIFPHIKICQPASGGFRFGCDSPLLAWFARIKKNWRVADAGSGSGVIAVLSAKMYGAEITAIEAQEGMFRCLKETVRLCSAEKEITPILADIGDYRTDKRFDAVICNPPYRKAGTGRVNADELEKNARFSFSMDLNTLVKFCRINMKHGGRLFFCYDADMLTEAVSVCRGGNMEPKRMRLVHPSPAKPARLLLMECVFGGGEELLIEPPLFQNGGESGEYADIFAGKWGLYAVEKR